VFHVTGGMKSVEHVEGFRRQRWVVALRLPKKAELFYYVA